MARHIYDSRALHVSPYRLALLMALGMFLLTFSISSLFAKSTLDQNRQDYQARLDQAASALQSHIDTSMQSYDRLLLSALALFAVKQDITQSDWTTFYNVAQAENSFPSLVGIGYASVKPALGIGAFEQAMQGSGETNFTVYPVPAGADAAPITYIMPSVPENERALGFDLYSSDIRRAALEKARDTDSVVVSAPIQLVQDVGKKDTPDGVDLYYPVYDTTIAPSSAAERQAHLVGYVYVALRPSDVISQYVASRRSELQDLAINVEDAADTTASLYQLNANKVAASATSSSADVAIDTRVWHVTVRGADSYTNVVSPIVLFVLGGIVSLLLAGITYWLLVSRIRNIATVYEDEVQRTKDELLALASHQLRTPASGVKQYIGILTSGMMGKLTTEQQTIAEKAYEANERQIQIINELLYVSKADAGQLVIEPNQFNLTKLVQKVVDSFADQAAQKSVTLLFVAKKPHLVVADDRYVAMIIENLISNAIKYSYPVSTVRISLASRRHSVLLAVKDRGVGVDKKNAERIFGKFNRIDNPLSHAEGGSGLGLFLARQLARAHGGDITVESKIDKGSTFTLSLPKELTINEAIVYLNPTRREDTQ